MALSMDRQDWSSPGCWAWDQRGTGQDGSSQAHPRPAAPHRLSQTCAPAAPITDKCSSVLACHSNSWQQEGSSRKWFIIPSFIRSALGSPRGEEPWDVQEEASASDGPVKGLWRWTRPLQPPSQLPPPSPLLPDSFHSHSSSSPLCLPASPPPWGAPQGSPLKGDLPYAGLHPDFGQPPSGPSPQRDSAIGISPMCGQSAAECRADSRLRPPRPTPLPLTSGCHFGAWAAPERTCPSFRTLCPGRSRLRHPEVSRGRFLLSDTFVLLPPLSPACPPDQPTAPARLTPRLSARLSLPLPFVAFGPLERGSPAGCGVGPLCPLAQPPARLAPRSPAPPLLPLRPTPPSLAPRPAPSNTSPRLLRPLPISSSLFPWPFSPWKSGLLLPSPLRSRPLPSLFPLQTPLLRLLTHPLPLPLAPPSLPHLFVSAENRRLLGTVPTPQCLW